MASSLQGTESSGRQRIFALRLAGANKFAKVVIADDRGSPIRIGTSCERIAMQQRCGWITRGGDGRKRMWQKEALQGSEGKHKAKVGQQSLLCCESASVK